MFYFCYKNAKHRERLPPMAPNRVSCQKIYGHPTSHRQMRTRNAKEKSRERDVRRRHIRTSLDAERHITPSLLTGSLVFTGCHGTERHISHAKHARMGMAWSDHGRSGQRWQGWASPLRELPPRGAGDAALGHERAREYVAKIIVAGGGRERLTRPSVEHGSGSHDVAVRV